MWWHACARGQVTHCHCPRSSLGPRVPPEGVPWTFLPSGLLPSAVPSALLVLSALLCCRVSPFSRLGALSTSIGLFKTLVLFPCYT